MANSYSSIRARTEGRIAWVGGTRQENFSAIEPGGYLFGGGGGGFYI